MKMQWALFTGLALSLIPSTVMAQTTSMVYWQTNGGGCVPTDKTIQDQQYWTVTGAGRIKYKGNGTQPLVFSCPVTSLNPYVAGGDNTALMVYYQDPDGPGTAFQVEATLKSFRKSDGAHRSQVCKVTSDQFGTWQNSLNRYCGFLDMNQNFYWVEVVLKRTQPSNSVVEFNGVSLVPMIN